jgi:hypothetical protein
MGQAAGIAAALSVTTGTDPRAIGADAVRERLLRDGALLEPIDPASVGA